jgi:hypothetical protein
MTKNKKKKGTRAQQRPQTSQVTTSSSLVRLGLLLLLIVTAAVGLTYLLAFFLPGERKNESLADADAEWAPVTIPAEDDPAKDGWDSEVFSEAARQQLKKLASLLIDGDATRDRAEELLDPTFHGEALRPPERERVLAGDGMTITRGGRSVDGNRAGETQSQLAAAAWLDSCGELSRLFEGATQSQFEIKIFRLEQQTSGITTEARFHASARTKDDHIQVQSVWRCHWLGANRGATPLLTRIEIVDYEEVRYSGDPSTLFVDCTQSVMGQNESYGRQLVPGYEEWFRQTPKIFDRKLWAEHGLALGDANGDELDDIYLCEPGSLPNRLFLHSSDGTVIDQSQSAGVNWYDQTRSALFVDLDNDGDQDLVVAITGKILMMANDGTGRFRVRAEVPEVPAAHAMAAADYDLDGMLDIYACSYFKTDSEATEYQVPIPYYNATNGGRNVLLRNEGNWQFRDVTARVGLDEANNRWSLAASWEDYDNDGDVDLYVANDFGRNCLYQNNAGKFENVASKAGVEDVGSSMSVAWADYNGDGLMDLYVSNMFSTAGGRITNQPRFQARASVAEKAKFRRMAKGNSLYANAGDGTFLDVSRDAAVAMGRWAWGAPFLDINNDGREDLMVANGFLTREDSRDL